MDSSAEPFLDPLSLAANRMVEEQAKEARKLEATRKREEAMRKKQEMMEKGSWFGNNLRKSMARQSRVSGSKPTGTGSTNLVPTSAAAPEVIPPSNTGAKHNFLYKKTAFMRASKIEGAPPEPAPPKVRPKTNLRQSKVTKGGALDYSNIYQMQSVEEDVDEGDTAPSAALQRPIWGSTGRSMKALGKQLVPAGRKTIRDRVVGGVQTFFGRRSQAHVHDDDDDSQSDEPADGEPTSQEVSSSSFSLEASTSASTTHLAISTADQRAHWERLTLDLSAGHIRLAKDDGGAVETWAADEVAALSLELVVRKADGSMLRLREPETEQLVGNGMSLRLQELRQHLAKMAQENNAC